jgi:uncharacterized membrane protein YciS (DUF1049 family)
VHATGFSEHSVDVFLFLKMMMSIDCLILLVGCRLGQPNSHTQNINYLLLQGHAKDIHLLLLLITHPNTCSYSIRELVYFKHLEFQNMHNIFEKGGADRVLLKATSANTKRYLPTIRE